MFSRLSKKERYWGRLINGSQKREGCQMDRPSHRRCFRNTLALALTSYCVIWCKGALIQHIVLYMYIHLKKNLNIKFLRGYMMLMTVETRHNSLYDKGPFFISQSYHILIFLPSCVFTQHYVTEEICTIIFLFIWLDNHNPVWVYSILKRVLVGFNGLHI